MKVYICIKKRDRSHPVGRCPLWSKIAEIWPGALGLPDLHTVQYTMYTDRNIYTARLQYTKIYSQLEPQAHGLIIAKG